MVEQQKNLQSQKPAQSVPLTEEQKREQAVAIELAKRQEKRKADRAAAKARVIEFMKTVKDSQLLADLKFFVSQARERGEPTVKAISAPLRDALVAAGARGMTGLAIYREFKLGEPEMRIKMRTLIQRAKPEERCFVSYDPKKAEDDGGTYTVVGVGAALPKGWTGFIPGESEEL